MLPAVSHRLDVYQDAAGEFRWRKVAERGNLPDEIVSEGGEGYTTRSDAVEAATRENPGLTINQVVPIEEE
jgi:uncharacterized protein YegP (UPF0339 family)